MTAPAKRVKPSSLKNTMLLEQDGGGTAPPVVILSEVGAQTRQMLIALGSARSFANGSLLFRQGDRHEGIYLVQRGLVRSFYTSEDGRELTLGFWGEGHYVGAPQMFGGGRHVWTSEAYGAVECMFLPGKELRALSEQRADLCLALLDALAHKSACYCTVLQLLATHSMKVRLARLLFTLAVREGARTHLTHGQLAGMIGSTRQWVSKTLSLFEDAGFVKRGEDGSVAILKPDALATLR